MEDWAEIRRLHRAEGVLIKEIARRLGVARNTVRSALESDRPPEYRRAPRGSVADAFEPQIRFLLQRFPRMPATVIAERIDWPYSMTPLKLKVAALRPEYQGIEPADQVSYRPGEVAECDLWFPEPLIPVAPGQERVLPVLVMTLGFSRLPLAEMIPSRQGRGHPLRHVVPDQADRTLAQDAGLGPGGRERGGTGRVTAPAAAFAGTLASRIRLAPPRGGRADFDFRERRPIGGTQIDHAFTGLAFHSAGIS